MNDIQFLELLKMAFKDYLNAPENLKPSLQQLLELVEIFREQTIEEYKKTLTEYENECTTDERRHDPEVRQICHRPISLVAYSQNNRSGRNDHE
ncbi:hypothetical protein ATE49_04460 [Elizabethkingia miricola]|uniref:Uncharacterized protein n=1 Tax=Elizabethkingia miricola TaxID=172045 RepID=A0ABY3NBK0_ELIMR|nr:hypothetical protein [Elizabethkingia miricola]MCT4238448.1 hypothetical protein [Elizabethkingia anophelis]OBS12739.1 hypothetical protein ATE49_04460 [Elizabethkingia miricola]TYO84529.1 hypothetical protein LX74_03953 [Elizabethkingia miricola]